MLNENEPASLHGTSIVRAELIDFISDIEWG